MSGTWSRRTLLASLGATVTTLAGCSTPTGSTNSSDIDQTQTPVVPDDPTAVQELGRDLLIELDPYYESVRVFVLRENVLGLHYESEAGSGDAVVSEYERIATLYADLVAENGYPPTTLSMFVGGVEVIVPSSSLEAYVSGEIDEEAFLETVGATDAESTETEVPS